MLVGGLRMVQASFEHRSVMVAEVVGVLSAVPPGVVVDATLGGGGHADALLSAAPHVSVLGFDQDPAAVAAAGVRLAKWGDRAMVIRARFDTLAQVLEQRGIGSISGALFDLGVSSPQLDDPARGFSYRADAPLDMRMDPGRPETAADVVNGLGEGELAQLIAANGEARFARRIAAALVAGRPVRTTGELASIVRDAMPAAARRQGGHPARRVFQALRIAVNQELDVLPGALDDAIALLAPGGRCAALAYHSGEDRIVKERFNEAATGGCVCPPNLPCVCGAVPSVRLLWRGSRRPRPEEVAVNRRAESARLRGVERVVGGHSR
jgi:16S rRNA (cytosine1402-N4)-methyltransferase